MCQIVNEPDVSHRGQPGCLRPRRTTERQGVKAMTLQEIHDFVCPLLDSDQMAQQEARLLICCDDGDVDVSKHDLEHVHAKLTGLACSYCTEMAVPEDDYAATGD